MAVLQQIWLYEIIGGMLPMCQNTTMWVNGAWIKRFCILCLKKQTYNALPSCHNFPAGSRQAAKGAHICETSLLQWSFYIGLHILFLNGAIKCLHFFLSPVAALHQYFVFVGGENSKPKYFFSIFGSSNDWYGENKSTGLIKNKTVHWY